MSPCCLSVYSSVSVHLSVYPILILGAFEAYEIIFLSLCVFPLNFFFRFSMRSMSYQSKVGG
jgi:hypothetical protein